MTVLLYALLREAWPKMTEKQLELATNLAHLADQGRQSAINRLQKLVYQVLFYRNSGVEEPPAEAEEPVMVQTATSE